MARRVTVDQLGDAMAELMEEYGDNVKENLDEIVAAMSKKGAQALRGEARGAVNGTKYAGGWKSQTETGRFSSQGTIYNAKLPGLPHLLEHGHANRNGGRTAGRPHIAKVEQALVREFEEKVKSAL